jgi:hypothetical protein
MLSILMLLADTVIGAFDDGKGGWDQAPMEGKGGWDAMDPGKAGW